MVSCYYDSNFALGSVLQGLMDLKLTKMSGNNVFVWINVFLLVAKIVD